MTLLIDVRTPEEFLEGHIDGAINIPVEEMVAGKLGALAEVAKETPLQVYCLSGARAGYAHTFLLSSGFSTVTNLGGIYEAMEVLK